jgi:hypothetical protein
MSERESTQVGYRLRIQPTDLSTYPDRAKLVWFDLVVKYGLVAKRRDLRRGMDKNGDIHPLAPRTIKYRRSEVGPVVKTAPRGIPALDLSRVMSLLIGRAHTSSAEFWWGFDSVSGASFAEILHYWADDQGHDVFGLSAAGTAWTLARAIADWEAWKASPEAGRLTAGRPGLPTARQIRKPIPKVTVRQNLEHYDLTQGEKSLIEKAIAAGRFRGFSRTNLRGEQWQPGPGPPHRPGVGPNGRGPGRTPPRPAPKPKPAPVKPVPVAVPRPAPPVIAPELLPGNFQTHEHVNKFFATTFPNAAIGALERIPVDVWNVHARELEILARKFPEVANRLKVISTKFEGWDGPNPAHPGWHAAAEMTRGDHLYVNPSHNQTPAGLAGANVVNEESGWWPKGSSAPSFTMTHEWGHLIDGWIRQEGRKPTGKLTSDSDWFKLREIFLKPEPNPDRDVDPIAAVSIYARTNHWESVAEAFAAARWTPKDEKTNTLLKFETVLREAITWIRNKP